MITNIFIYNFLTTLDWFANMVIIFYFFAFLIVVKELDFDNIDPRHFIAIGIAIAIMFLVPTSDLLRILLEIPPKI